MAMIRGQRQNFFGADTTVPVGVPRGREGRILRCLTGKPMPGASAPRSQGLVDVRLAGDSELPFDERVDRSVAVTGTKR